MLNGAHPHVAHRPEATRLEDRILDIVAACTRYPREHLTLDADFEDDLGIDSVKRAEIAARLTEELTLPGESVARLSATRTLRSLTAAITPVRSSPPTPPTPAEPAAPLIAPLLTAAPSVAQPPADTLGELSELSARVTRYPIELLTPDADFEAELGIDSVKLQEILATARQRFPAIADKEPPRAFRTLRELSTWIASEHASREPAPRAPLASSTRRQALPERCFEGKIALISGSGHGLGRVTALELARRGARVVINSFHQRELGEATAREICQEGGEARHVWASMARPEQVERLFSEVNAGFGGLDFFIHNASSGVFAKLADATEEDWLKSFRTNVLGLHQGALRARELMRARGGGKILALSSVFHDATMDYFGVQGPIKASVESLTRFLAKELMPDNIQVNCVSLGALEGQAMSLYPEVERIVTTTEARSLGGRRMTELEAAEAQLLLLGRQADSITGSVFRVDRGMLLS
jgi:enoyl-[acyl-carrier protein] reductase III